MRLFPRLVAENKEKKDEEIVVRAQVQFFILSLMCSRHYL